MTIWLYHINPKNKYGYTMGWDISRPRSLLRASDHEWGSGSMFNKVQPGDSICVFMKNIPKRPDGVYIIGTVQAVGLEGGAFRWSVDRKRSARVLLSPLTRSSIRRFFSRSYGGSMQQLAKRREKAWLSLLGRNNEVFRDAPVVRVRRAPPRHTSRGTEGDPEVSRENGRKGERYILDLLRSKFSPRDGYCVEHVARKNPGADHDISVRKGNRLIQIVEVKTRFGKPPDPVLISDRELCCRRKMGAKHVIFVVYLTRDGFVHSTVRIGRQDAYQLFARQYWLHPGPI